MGWNNSVELLDVPKTSAETLLRRTLSGTPSFRFLCLLFRINAILMIHGTYVLPEGISKEQNRRSELIHSSLFLIISILQ
jgi:hypothetical protein